MQLSTSTLLILQCRKTWLLLSLDRKPIFYESSHIYFTNAIPYIYRTHSCCTKSIYKCADCLFFVAIPYACLYRSLTFGAHFAQLCSWNGHKSYANNKQNIFIFKREILSAVINLFALQSKHVTFVLSVGAWVKCNKTCRQAWVRR